MSFTCILQKRQSGKLMIQNIFRITTHVSSSKPRLHTKSRGLETLQKQALAASWPWLRRLFFNISYIWAGCCLQQRIKIDCLAWWRASPNSKQSEKQSQLTINVVFQLGSLICTETREIRKTSPKCLLSQCQSLVLCCAMVGIRVVPFGRKTACRRIAMPTFSTMIRPSWLDTIAFAPQCGGSIVVLYGTVCGKMSCQKISRTSTLQSDIREVPLSTTRQNICQSGPSYQPHKMNGLPLSRFSYLSVLPSTLFMIENWVWASQHFLSFDRGAWQHLLICVCELSMTNRPYLIHN